MWIHMAQTSATQVRCPQEEQQPSLGCDSTPCALVHPMQESRIGTCENFLPFLLYTLLIPSLCASRLHKRLQPENALGTRTGDGQPALWSCECMGSMLYSNSSFTIHCSFTFHWTDTFTRASCKSCQRKDGRGAVQPRIRTWSICLWPAQPMLLSLHITVSSAQA